jgi:hypothetical protein
MAIAMLAVAAAGGVGESHLSKCQLTLRRAPMNRYRMRSLNQWMRFRYVMQEHYKNQNDVQVTPSAKPGEDQESSNF